MTYRVEHEAVDTEPADGKNNHRRRTIECVARGDDLATALQSVAFARLAVTNLFLEARNAFRLDSRNSCLGAHFDKFYGRRAQCAPITALTFFQIANIDPMETRQSILDEPSKGSKATMYCDGSAENAY